MYLEIILTEVLWDCWTSMAISQICNVWGTGSGSLKLTHSFISIQTQRPVRQEPEPGYGADMALGTLHPRQVLGGSLPLLSPAFRHSHFCRHVPLRPQRRERSQQRKVELWSRKMSDSNFA